MKLFNATSFLVTVFSIGIIATQSGFAQTSQFFKEISFGERNLGGPRLGVSYVSPGQKMAEEMSKRNFGKLFSQFGWHFEYQVIPEGGGPQFVIQFVPLIAGVEYGTLIPSGTLAMGVRMPEGYEFGLGPQVMVNEMGVGTALVISLGKSFDYGGVSIPVNFVYVTNPEGQRFSVIFGYAITKSSELIKEKK